VLLDICAEISLRRGRLPAEHNQSQSTSSICTSPTLGTLEHPRRCTEGDTAGPLWGCYQDVSSASVILASGHGDNWTVQKLLRSVKKIIRGYLPITVRTGLCPKLENLRGCSNSGVLYGCETRSLTLREERRLKVFENRVLRRIVGSKRDEVTGEWRKLHNEELRDLYSSPKCSEPILHTIQHNKGKKIIVTDAKGCSTQKSTSSTTSTSLSSHLSVSSSVAHRLQH
jgi:hypothetical protein